MDREAIRKIIEENHLTRNSPGLQGVLVRTFEELLKLDAQLSGSDQGRQSSAELTKENARLQQENEQLEQSIVECNAATVKYGKETDAVQQQEEGDLAEFSQAAKKQEATIMSLEEECRKLKSEIAVLEGKPAEMERLKQHRDELRETKKQLLAEIDGLGEEYQRNVELLNRLRPFVESMEALETQMKQTMGNIWSGLKKDAFDRMC